MMSHRIHSCFCFILKPRKIWWSRGSCCRLWASSGVRHNFPQMHFKKGAGKNNSPENVKNSSSSFPLPVFFLLWSHGGCWSFSQLHIAEGRPKRVAGPLHGPPYVSIWRFGTLLQDTFEGVLQTTPSCYQDTFHVLSIPELEPRLFHFSIQSPTDQLPPESETKSRRTDHILTVAPSPFLSLRVSCFLQTVNINICHLVSSDLTREPWGKN